MKGANITKAVNNQKKSPQKPSDQLRRQTQPDEVAGIVSANLNYLRRQRGLSLEALAGGAGVSRGMLRQIELGRSVPTISLLWKVAKALDVPFSALISDRNISGTVFLPSAKTRTLTSASGGFTSRALFPFERERQMEFYKLTLAPNTDEIANAHPPGTKENLTVSKGKVEMIVGGVSYILNPEDAIAFEADVPHCYRNIGSEEACMYLVMTYLTSTSRH